MKTRHYSSCLLAGAFALVGLATARAEDSTTTIRFSDPAKPGTVKIILARGDLRIKGDDTAEVTVRSEAKPVTKAPRKDGLRVITASSSFSLTEKDNLVTLDAAAEGWIGAPSDFRLTVPRNTSIVLASSFGGDVTCSGLSGDLEIKSMNGEVKLDDIAGGALVETMNGEIHASVRELHDGKPLSFTSMNGEVVLRVPAAAKANVRLRTQNGSILTDFDEKALVTKTENTPRSTGKRLALRAPKATPPLPAAPVPPATPAPAAPPRSDESPDHDAAADIQATVHDAMRLGAEAAREGMAAAREAIRAAHDGMVAGGWSIPPMTGGKLVTGTLNGGGPEISIATMNGDVTLRQLESKM